MTDLATAISEAFDNFQSNIELQPHQNNFCAATQDLVFFGGK